MATKQSGIIQDIDMFHVSHAGYRFLIKDGEDIMGTKRLPNGEKDTPSTKEVLHTDNTKGW